MLKRKVFLYPVIGFFLGLCAPVGFLFLRIIFYSAYTFPGFVAEMQMNAMFYTYMLVGTTTTFVISGYFIGKQGDHLEEEVERRTHELRQIHGQLLDHIREMESRCQNCGTVRDLQIQVIQSEKLATIGKFSTAVAHEINNPLMGIRNALSILLSESVEDGKKAQYRELMEQSFGRIETTVRNLLGFARKEEFRMEPTDINALVQQSLILCEPRIKEGNVQLKTTFTPLLSSVSADAALLQRVLLNLILNAVDAMEEAGGGKLLVETSASNGFVKISVADEGKGIPEEDLSKIFEPFYTTKSQGTGLGLSVCHEIVQKHRGRILVHSTVGKGTTVDVLLPHEERIPA